MKSIIILMLISLCVFAVGQQNNNATEAAVVANKDNSNQNASAAVMDNGFNLHDCLRNKAELLAHEYIATDVVCQESLFKNPFIEEYNIVPSEIQ
jgi:hypothetical protein